MEPESPPVLPPEPAEQPVRASAPAVMIAAAMERVVLRRIVLPVTTWAGYVAGDGELGFCGVERGFSVGVSGRVAGCAAHVDAIWWGVTSWGESALTRASRREDSN
ncbi:hypothetical protein GCM10010471_08990 [Leucobacter komagatae]